MENMIEISQEVFDFLEDYRKEDEQSNRKFYYTLRRSNNAKKLEKGFWFYGNEQYLAVSFWSGMDWKSKTPNIYFFINGEGKTYLIVSCRDSKQKSDNIKNYFVDSLELTPDGSDVWTKEISGEDYIDALQKFIDNEKFLIDNIIRTNINATTSEDTSNSIGFIKATDFFSWLENVKKYQSDEDKTVLPFSLTKFSVQKYHPIISTTFGRIPKNTPFIILVGENGSGKSSILKALAIALGNKYFTEIFNIQNSQWIINFNLNIRGKINKFKTTNFDFKIENFSKVPFACFGPSRLIVDNRNERPTTNESNRDVMHPLWSLFNPDAILKDINKWLLQKISDENKLLNTKNINLLFENIKQMLIDIIPNLYDIREVQFNNTTELLYFELDMEGNKIEKGVIFEHLSSGLRSLIAMLGDMMIRLFEQQNEITDPAALCGIVLIDEIDIHLHPKWQKKIPEILSENFPKIQFIVTTHSPVPLLGIPLKSKIYNVSREIHKGVTIKSLNYLNVSNLLPNTILTSAIFGMDDLVSVNNKDLSEVNVDDDMDDTNFFNILDKKMDELSKKENLFNKKYFN